MHMCKKLIPIVCLPFNISLFFKTIRTFVYKELSFNAKFHQVVFFSSSLSVLPVNYDFFLIYTYLSLYFYNVIKLKWSYIIEITFNS